jgi:peptidoglycan/LPS O-acetylase OafA/YrhL
MTTPLQAAPDAVRSHLRASFATEGRDFGLDVLRASAIAMVMVHHGVSVKGLPVLGAFGTGVDLFFVLSGFLIGRIYFRSRLAPSFSLMSFWQARWLRTLPPYFAMLAIYSWLEGFPGSSYLVFLQNYTGIGGLGISWSLCVEEQFYLLFPALALFMDRLVPRRLVPATLFITTLAPLGLRLWLASTPGGLPAGWWFQTHLHAEGLAVGVSLAWLAVEAPGSSRRRSRSMCGRSKLERHPKPPGTGLRAR